MKKIILKNICTIIGLILIVALTPTTSFASNNTLSELEGKDLKEQAVFTIEANSQEEYDKIIEEIDAHNEKANALWEKALIQSEAEAEESENQISNLNLIQPYAYTVQSTYSSRKLGSYWARIGFSATYNRAYSTYYYVNSVYSVDAFAGNSDTSVSTNHKKYTLIDGSRTIAANYSIIVGVKQLGGQYEYYSLAYYVEFYASGGAYVW